MQIDWRPPWPIDHHSSMACPSVFGQHRICPVWGVEDDGMAFSGSDTNQHLLPKFFGSLD